MIASDESSHRIVRPKRHDGSLSRWRQIVPVHPMRSAQITQFCRKAALVGKLHGIMLRMAEAETMGQCRFQWFDCGFDNITSYPDLPRCRPVSCEGFLAVMHQGFIFKARRCEFACQHAVLGDAVERARIADEAALVGEWAGDVLDVEPAEIGTFKIKGSA